MRIGYDLRPLQVTDQNTGISVYIRCLLKNISRIDKENEYFFLTIKGSKFPDISIENGFKAEEIKLPSIKPAYFNLFYDKFILKNIIKKHNLDIAHFPSPLELKLNFDLAKYNNRSVITMYDLTPYFFRDRIFTGKRKLIEPLYFYALSGIKKAGGIIAISDCTRRDIIKNLGIPDDKITVTHLGKDEIFKRVEDEEVLDNVKFRFKLPDKFILYVGMFAKHKNLDQLLEALSYLKSEHNIKANLVITGKFDFFYLQLKARIEELDISDQVYFTGFVPLDDLPALYSLSTVFAFPSLYEGFGLPVIEAMACGTPVACSDRSSLPEVAGDAAIMFDPDNHKSIAEALKNLYIDEDLQNQMRLKGEKRAAEFTWEDTARKTIEVYMGRDIQKK